MTKSAVIPHQAVAEPITPVERSRADAVLKKAKVQLAIKHPFFGQIALNRKITLADGVQTAYIDARGRITIGLRFLSRLSVQQCVFLLAHESMHWAMLHLLRRNYRDQRKWNVACDAVINDLLAVSSVGEPIPGAVNMPGSKDKHAEKIYDELPDPPPDGGGSYQPGSGSDDLSEGGHDDEQLDESEKREIEAKVRTELAAAAQTAKQQGALPGHMERLLDDIINPVTPWHILLERYMTGFVNDGYSFRRPNRRYVDMNMYMPSSDRLPRMGPVVIEMDESGSVGQKEREHFAGHINSILEKCRPEKVIVLHVDSTIAKVEEFTMDDLPIQVKNYACGGTDMRVGVDWVEREGVEPDVFICLTDGYTPFPNKEPAFPTVWLITSDQKSTIGDTIPYRMEE